MSNSRYYISTGAQNCFYTLRYTFTEAGQMHVGDGRFEPTTITRDYHCRNLSIDREQAIEKARAITGKGLNAEFEVRPIERREDIDWSILQGGRYRGMGIHELAQTKEGVDYLCFLAGSCCDARRYSKTIELVRVLLAHELKEKQEAKDAEAAAQETARKAIAAKAQPLIEVLKSRQGEFAQSVAQDMASGHLPKGRGATITADIYAKAHGRRNSKAYNEAYEQAFEILKEVA